jgi:hypothetical protein
MRAGPADSSLRHRWVAYAGASWALVFAFFHIIWAAGWYVGLDPDQARAMFTTPWKLAYDVVVAVMCIIAVPVALALALPWGERVPRRLLSALAWTGTGLLVLRAVASLIQTAYLAATGRFSLRVMGVWEPWFYLGATLFAVNLWLYCRRVRQRSTTTAPWNSFPRR